MILLLSNELLLAVADCFVSESDISSFTRTNRRLHELLNPCLYRQNARKGHSSALVWAAQHGYCTAAAKAIQYGADVNIEIQDFGRPCRLMHLVAKLGFADMVNLLLVAEAIDPNTRDYYGNTPLHYAIRETHYDMTKLMLESGKANVDARDGLGMTPLLHAAHRGLTELVKLLLATSKVNVNHCDHRGRTALCYASMRGSAPIAKLLLGVSGINLGSKDVDGQNALSFAAARGHDEIVRLLLDVRESDTKPTSYKGRTASSINSRVDIRHKDRITK